MKLASRTDIAKLPLAHKLVRAVDKDRLAPAQDHVTLAHDERHLRRRVIHTASKEKILLDLPEPVHLVNQDRLVLDDGRTIEVVASKEVLYEARPRDALHLAVLCWHIGNRHLAAQIEEDRILVPRDPVIMAMLEGLGARVTPVCEPFEPVHGAYSGHNHAHGHANHHDHDGGAHGGQLPADPHTGRGNV